jgi:hypothetical protein
MHGCKDNIETDFMQMGYEDNELDRTPLGQDPLMTF